MERRKIVCGEQRVEVGTGCGGWDWVWRVGTLLGFLEVGLGV